MRSESTAITSSAPVEPVGQRSGHQPEQQPRQLPAMAAPATSTGLWVCEATSSGPAAIIRPSPRLAGPRGGEQPTEAHAQAGGDHGLDESAHKSVRLCLRPGRGASEFLALAVAPYLRSHRAHDQGEEGRPADQTHRHRGSERRGRRWSAPAAGPGRGSGRDRHRGRRRSRRRARGSGRSRTARWSSCRSVGPSRRTPGPTCRPRPPRRPTGVAVRLQVAGIAGIDRAGCRRRRSRRRRCRTASSRTSAPSRRCPGAAGRCRGRRARPCRAARSPTGCRRAA